VLAPDDPEPRFRLMMVRDRQGNAQQVVHQAREVLRLDGSYKARILACIRTSTGAAGSLGKLVATIVESTADGPPSRNEIEDFVDKARRILGDDDSSLDGNGLKVRLGKLGGR
jgi:hypothetical protein